MTEKTDALGDIFVDVAGETTVTESQREDVSHDPVDSDDLRLEEEVASAAREDGLTDAIAGAEVSDGAA